MQLTVQEIMSLKDQFPTATPLSLFDQLALEPEGGESDTLAEKGITHQHQLTEEARNLLSVMAGARNASKLVIKDPLLFVEKYCYRMGEQRVLVENTKEGLLFSSMESVDPVLEEMTRWIGNSNYKTAEFALLLPEEELMVLLAVMDLQRREVLEHYIGHRTETAVFFSFEQIRRELEEPMANAITKLMRINFGLGDPRPEDLKNLLEKLVQRNVLLKDGEVYGLEDEYLLFASRFLVPTLFSTLDAVAMTEAEEVVKMQAFAVSAGLRDHGVFLLTDEGVEFSSLTSNEVLAMAGSFINCPDLQRT